MLVVLGSFQVDRTFLIYFLQWVSMMLGANYNRAMTNPIRQSSWNCVFIRGVEWELFNVCTFRTWDDRKIQLPNCDFSGKRHACYYANILNLKQIFVIAKHQTFEYATTIMYVIFFDSVQNQLNPGQTFILSFLTNKTFDGTVLGLDTSLNLLKLCHKKETMQNHGWLCSALKEG